MTQDLLEQFIAIVGAEYALTEEGDVAPYLKEWRGRWTGRTAAVLRPGSTGEVSHILKLATETGTPVVPQGGNTGLVGGQIPDDSGNAIILSTARLNTIFDIDPAGNTITVGAGVIMQAVHEAADDHDRLFPLSVGAKGSCQIGGNLSTNAGGLGALAYGVARDLCLGLEVVLPTGEVLDSMNRLKKDNTGYDLRDLFIGAEGTLGVITAAVLKLYPKPVGVATAVVGLPSPEAALSLFDSARAKAGSGLTAFELAARMVVHFTVKNVPDNRDPLSEPQPWYVLMEISSGRSSEDARATLEAILEEAYESGLVTDGVLAESEQQRAAFWHLRESMSESQIPEGGSIKHDVSVPVAKVPDFLTAADKAVLALEPEARVCAFGHLGDGNIHYNISQPEGADKAAFLARTGDITPAVHGIVRDFSGSISAEHGIGQMKRDELAETKPPVALALMRRIKAVLDPAGIMNPGKVL